MLRHIDIVYLGTVSHDRVVTEQIGLSRRASDALEQQGIKVELTDAAKKVPEIAERNDHWGMVSATQETKTAIRELKARGVIA